MRRTSCTNKHEVLLIGMKFILQLYWHEPPLTRAPAPAPPLRLSLPAVLAGLRLCPGRLSGRLRYRSAPRPSPRQGPRGECLSLPHPPVHTLDSNVLAQRTMCSGWMGALAKGALLLGSRLSAEPRPSSITGLPQVIVCCRAASLACDLAWRPASQLLTHRDSRPVVLFVTIDL